MSAIYGVVNFSQSEKDLIGPGRSEKEKIQEEKSQKVVIDKFCEGYAACKIDRMESMEHCNANFGCGLQYFNEEAKLEQLPYYDTKKNILFTADCVLDNRAQLALELGLSPETADGAVIYQAYLNWGEQCFSKLRGVFAVAVYDFGKNELLLAVDQFAQRCLFYYYQDHQVLFSTLFFPLLRQEQINVEENTRWLLDSISLRTPVMITEPKETAVKNIYKVVSGTYIKMKADGQTEETRYYDPEKTIKTKASISLEESEKLMQEAMRDSVRGILRENTMIGSQLSAGLDSSTVACLAAALLQEKGKELRSYTSIPMPEAKLENNTYYLVNESEGVQKVCAEYPNIIPTFVDSAKRNYLKEVDQILRIWEMPCKSEQNAIWGDEICKQAAAEGCKILLTGATGNCTLSAGDIVDMVYYYAKHLNLYRANRMLNMVQKSGGSRKRFVKSMIQNWKEYYKWYFKPELRDCYAYCVTKRELGEEYEFTNRLTKSFFHLFPFADNKEYRRRKYMVNANAQIGEIDTKCSLEHGILLRDPMRTVEVVNLCFALPMKCFANEDYDRRLVRVGMKGVVPEAIRCDVKHRGRQSGDNEYRIGLVWEEMLPQMKKALYSERTLKYLSKDELDAYFKRLECELEKRNLFDLRMIVDAYTFARYLELLQQKV